MSVQRSWVGCQQGMFRREIRSGPNRDHPGWPRYGPPCLGPPPERTMARSKHGARNVPVGAVRIRTAVEQRPRWQKKASIGC